jgi:ribose transport system substrate-binding protein
LAIATVYAPLTAPVCTGSDSMFVIRFKSGCGPGVPAECQPMILMPWANAADMAVRWDAASQKTAIAAAVAQGIKIIGWHSAGTPGPWPDLNLITNIESDPQQTGAVSGAYTVAMADGKAGVVVFTDSAYAIAIVKHDAMLAAVNAVEGSWAELVDTPIAEVQTRMPGITTGLYQQYGATLNWMIAVNDLYFDFAIPTLRTLGAGPVAHPGP